MTAARRWVVRVVLFGDVHPEMRLLIDQLHTVGIARQHATDHEGVLFDLLPPAVATGETVAWARSAATTMRGQGFNAEAAPEWLDDDA